MIRVISGSYLDGRPILGLFAGVVGFFAGVATLPLVLGVRAFLEVLAIVSGMTLIPLVNAIPSVYSIRFQFARGCWVRFGLQRGAMESQKKSRVNILECWLNTQHGWGLIMDEPI